MKWNSLLFFLTIFIFFGVFLSNNSGYAKDNVSMVEFVKMSFEERVEVCSRLVSSDEIGDCASIRPPSGEPFKATEINAIAAPCFNRGLTDSADIAECVHAKLGEKGAPPEFPCIQDIARAYEICAATVESKKIAACTSSLCTRLDVK